MTIDEQSVADSLSPDIEKSLAMSITLQYTQARKSHLSSNFEQVLIHGGKFVEAVFHHLESLVTGIVPIKLGSMRDIARNLETTKEIPDSFRIHIPRLLLTAYGFRSKGDGAHWVRYKEAKSHEAEIVLSILNYVMIELIHDPDKNNPTGIENHLLKQFWEIVPLVQFIDGKIFINNPNISARESLLLLLYSHPSQKLSFDEICFHLDDFSKANMRISLKRAADMKLIRWGEKFVTLSRLGARTALEIMRKYA